MMAAAAGGSPAKEELTVPPAAQPHRGASAGPTPTLLHDSALHSATNITAASTALITPESLAASLHSSVSSPTGTKLAVTTPSESPAGGEGARITLDEEKKIALSQLQELEVAIKVRRVTKVDGRKVRWIEYRARKQAEEEKQSANGKKRPRRSRSKTKAVENSENETSVNNNNNNNNNTKTDSTMKGDSTSSPLSVVGTSNVLESMKQQFLQGTENADEPAINGKSGILAESSITTQKRKSGRTRKSAGASEGGSPSSTSPKKLSPSEASAKGACLRSCGASKGSSSANGSISESPLTLSSTPTTPFTSDQPLAIGIKKNFFTPRSLTKGLREVRKVENGTDGVIAVKAEEVTTPLTSPSASLHLTALTSVVSDGAVSEAKPLTDSKSQSADTKATKTMCPLIKAAAKLMSHPTARSKSADSSAKGKKGNVQKGSGRKASTKSVPRPESESRTAVNGHNQMVQNGSSEECLGPVASYSLGEACSGKASKQGNAETTPGTASDSDSSIKRPRGRPPKRKLVLKKEGTATASPGKSGKKLATLVVDVHNTMNGEPQMVIPVSRPVLRGKRASSKNPSQNEKSPDIKHSPVPASKRQKNEAKLKLDTDALPTGVSSSSSQGDAKKAKTNKKNIEPLVDVKEEKDDTSASTVNQIQIPPDQTQSTKHTKGVQRNTNKEVPSQCESYTAMPSNLHSKKKKKVKKPVLKVKTLPTKHKEIEKIIKKSKKATSGGVTKQNRAQPKKNTISKYLITQKGKAPPKMITNKKAAGVAQMKPKSISGEGESQGEEGVGQKQEPTHINSDLMDVQCVDPSPQKDCVLKSETPEINVQNMSALNSKEEDSDLKANLAGEVPCIASSTVPAVDYGEESPVEVKPNFVPRSETETHPLTGEDTTTVDILGINKSYEKVSDLPKISFQNNDNINNNNAEEEGVVICDKEITVLKDLSAKKLSTADESIKCITNEECSLEELASKTKVDTTISKGSIETVLGLEQETIKKEEHQMLAPDADNTHKKDCSVENSFQDEVPSVVDLKSEENVCDKNEGYVETVAGGDDCHIPAAMVALESSEMESNSIPKESILSSSSLGETPKELEVPFLEAATVPASDPSLPDSTASATALQEASTEVVEEASGCEKLSPPQSDPEDKVTQSCSFTDEVMLTTESMKTKDTDPIESDVTEVSQVEVNQAVDSTAAGDSEVQVVEVQRDTQQDQDVSVVSQKSSGVKQIKRREGSIVHKKKKSVVQSHSIVQLEDGNEDMQEEINVTKVTKAQEASQEESAGKTHEGLEMMDTLPPSQKETDEVQELIPEVQPTRLISAPEVHSSSTTKTKDKVPRILKQLFQDEGVQNMLKSMGEDSGAVQETSPNSDSGTHKLRPKRITEPMLSSSPELDAMEAFLTSSRKKKRGTELDTLYIDEGVLNLLTSKEHPSRRTHQEDASSDVSQASSSKSFKMGKTTKSGELLSDSRKRKLSGASTASNTSSSSKSLQPPEPKKVRIESQEPVEDPYELDIAEEFKDKPVIVGYSTLETTVSIAKKKGLPVVPLSVKQKNKAIKMQLKIQKQKHLKSVVIDGSEDQEQATSNMVHRPNTHSMSKGVYPEASSLPSSVEIKEIPGKSVPPIKIKLASDSVTIKPIPRPSPPRHTAEVTIVAKPAPVRVPIKPPQVVDSTSPPLARSSPLSQMRASPEKSRPHHERHSPSSQLRRTENYPGGIPPAPPIPGFPSLVRSCDAATAAAAAAAAASKSRQRVGGESVRQSQRASVRQSEANYHFRDISLRKFNNFTQIILSPSTTKMKNALNSRVLRELCEALNILKRDESVRIVLLTGTGSTFCQGVDLTALQHPNLETRKKNAENLVRGIKDFLKALVQFSKPIIAGVNGNAMGLGVTMLPLFDMVIANDKAEFCLPYAKLGQVPEGGATYTFPNLCGKLQSTQLFLGHKLTARRAQEMGLVSESIWPATYQQELIPKVALLATQSAQSMEATKALMNHHLVTKLELSLESECRLLLQQWTSPHFAHLCKRFLDTQYIHLQKPVSLPL